MEEIKAPPKIPKGQRKCNACRGNCQMKNGDWFLAGETYGQQIFLCRDCERRANGAYKRASPLQFGR